MATLIFFSGNYPKKNELLRFITTFYVGLYTIFSEKTLAYRAVTHLPLCCAEKVLKDQFWMVESMQEDSSIRTCWDLSLEFCKKMDAYLTRYDETQSLTHTSRIFSEERNEKEKNE